MAGDVSDMYRNRMRNELFLDLIHGAFVSATKKAPQNVNSAGPCESWLPDLGSNQGPTD